MDDLEEGEEVLMEAPEVGDKRPLEEDEAAEEGAGEDGAGEQEARCPARPELSRLMP
jgi:hypothetical protein